MSTTTFTWDGSFLGVFSIAPWWYTCRYMNRTYGFLALQDGWQTIHIVRSKNILPLIVDQIKPMFNLLKRGSHHLQINKVHYIIYFVPCNLTQDKALYEVPLSAVSTENIKYLMQDEIFTSFMRAIIIFCQMAHIVISNDKIWLRLVKYQDSFLILPMLCMENKIVPHTTIPVNMKKRWCNYIPSDQLMTYIVEDDSIINRIQILQQVENIIRKIDINYLYLFNFISATLYRM